MKSMASKQILKLKSTSLQHRGAYITHPNMHNWMASPSQAFEIVPRWWCSMISTGNQKHQHPIGLIALYTPLRWLTPLPLDALDQPIQGPPSWRPYFQP